MRSAGCHPGPLAQARRRVRLKDGAAARVHANAVSCASDAPLLNVCGAQDGCRDVPGAVYEQDTVRNLMAYSPRRRLSF